MLASRRWLRRRWQSAPSIGAWQQAEGRQKRMLIADMDFTIIGQESLDEMAELKGIRAEVVALHEACHVPAIFSFEKCCCACTHCAARPMKLRSVALVYHAEF